MLVAISNEINGLNFEPTLLPEPPTLGHTVAKPKGPVTQKHLWFSVCKPQRYAGFCHVQNFAVHRLVHRFMVWGMVGATRKGVRTAEPVFLTTMLHPMLSKMQTVVPLSRSGAKTMTAITRAHTSAPTPAVGKPGTILTSHLQSVLAAFNAANMASSYIERGNFTAARRKLAQALASINQLNTQEA